MAVKPPIALIYTEKYVFSNHVARARKNGCLRSGMEPRSGACHGVARSTKTETLECAKRKASEKSTNAPPPGGKGEAAQMPPREILFNQNYNSRRGEYGEAARKPRSARLPKSTQSPARGEPPQTAARATLWNFARRRAERMRHVRAADRRCTVCFRGVYPHTAHRPCPHPARRIVLRTMRRPRKKSPSATLSIVSKPTFGSRGDVGAAKTPPAPKTPGVLPYAVDSLPNPSPSKTQSVEEPKNICAGKKRTGKIPPRDVLNCDRGNDILFDNILFW